MLIKNINRIPFTPLIVVALMLGLAPFSPEPHLLEKTRMLLEGSLQRPLDLFDLALHATPVLLLCLRLTTRYLFSENKNT